LTQNSRTGVALLSNGCSICTATGRRASVSGARGMAPFFRMAPNSYTPFYQKKQTGLAEDSSKSPTISARAALTISRGRRRRCLLCLPSIPPGGAGVPFFGMSATHGRGAYIPAKNAGTYAPPVVGGVPALPRHIGERKARGHPSAGTESGFGLRFDTSP
jgi:hypothetical protein